MGRATAAVTSPPWRAPVGYGVICQGRSFTFEGRRCGDLTYRTSHIYTHIYKCVAYICTYNYSGQEGVGRATAVVACHHGEHLSGMIDVREIVCTIVLRMER